MEKLHGYQGFSGRLHEWRDDLKAKFANWRENHEGESLVDLAKNSGRNASASDSGDKDYSHIYRSVMHKTRTFMPSIRKYIDDVNLSLLNFPLKSFLQSELMS